MHTHPKLKFILHHYLQNIRKVPYLVSIGSFTVHMSNYQPFPITSTEKQHRKMFLIKQLVSWRTYTCESSNFLGNGGKKKKKSDCFMLLPQRVHFGLFTASEACSSLLRWPLDWVKEYELSGYFLKHITSDPKTSVTATSIHFPPDTIIIKPNFSNWLKNVPPIIHISTSAYSDFRADFPMYFRIKIHLGAESYGKFLCSICSAFTP